MNAPERMTLPPETYYGHAAVKPSFYHARVALYTFLGGLAGAAQAIGALASALAPRRKSIPRHAAWIGTGIGAAVGPALLVADLHTPRRWYNMLRIFRPTSPMSIGTYVLTGFAGSSLLSLLGVKAARLPAAVAGAGMASYTPALLASTATPLWSSSPRGLGAEFATSAFATGAAALSLAEHIAGHDDTRALDRIALASILAHAAATLAAESQHERDRVERPLRDGRWAAMHKAGLAIGIGLPLACYAVDLFAKPSRGRSMLASLGVCAGGFLSRWALFEAGNESAKSAPEYLRMHGEERR